MPIARLFDDLRRDARGALRQWAARRGFAALALTSLALGIGAPTAVFSVVNGVLLTPLPYADPDRIVTFSLDITGPNTHFVMDALPVAEALDWAARTETLDAVAIYNDRALTLSTSDGPFRLAGLSATPALFDVLGAKPLVGRLFGADDTDLRQVVLSHATWQQRFGGDPRVIGQTVPLDGAPFRVVAVMPAAFGFPSPETAFWIPQVLESGGTRGMVLPVVARLRSGVPIEAAVYEGRRLVAPDDGPMRQVLTADTLHAQLVGAYAGVLWMLMAVVSIVAVVASVNVALLVLTRGAGRTREFEIRLAIGATRGRLVRQVFAEAAMLAGAGGALGVALAALGMRLLLVTAPPDIPRLVDVSLDARVLLFAAAASILACVVFGLLSVARVTRLRLSPSGALISLPRIATAAASRRRLSALAAIELALTLVLLVTAAMLLRSFVSRVLVPPGFNARGALAFSVHLPAARYPGAAPRAAFLERLQQRLESLPNVASVGLAAEMPNRQPTGRFMFAAGGIDMFADPSTQPIYEVRMVSRGFIEAMGLRLQRGRAFSDADVDGADPVIVISSALAAEQFPDADPLGQILYSGSGNRRVIGVVDDVLPASPRGQLRPSAYLPLAQALSLLDWHASMNVVVKTRAEAGVPDAVRRAVLELDAELPPSNVRWLDDELWNLFARPRFSAAVVATLASVALVMAALGVYGVIAHGTAQRTREFGVRIAVGATPATLARLVARDAAVVIGAGVAAGLVGAAWSARALGALIAGVPRRDVGAVVAVTAVLMAAGALAAFIPARRAARLTVVAALRDQ
jgi:predicted permease